MIRRYPLQCLLALMCACSTSLPEITQIPAATCGDGIVRADLVLGQQGYEACDDGNIDDRDACTNRCEVARCGDGIRRRDLLEDSAEFEACDDGNTNDQDNCTILCAPPFCGDGIVHANEACDDGNDQQTDTCLNNCELASCGDGILQAGEICDDGNRQDDDYCLNDCTLSRCGDGVLHVGEECDDGNLAQTDGCLSDCQLPRCGDGYERFDPGGVHTEACDDGNAIDEDACTSLCTVARCGDGVVRADLELGEAGFEVCDDGNTEPMDECSVECRLDDHGDTIEFATALTAGGVDGLVQRTDDLDQLRWVADLPGTYRFRTESLPLEGTENRIDLTASVSDAHGELLNSRNTATGANIFVVELEVTLVAQEVVYLTVQSAFNLPSARYRVSIQTTCGNGVVEAHESCDPEDPSIGSFSCREDCNWRRSMVNSGENTCFNQNGALWCTGYNGRLLLGEDTPGLGTCAIGGRFVSCARRPLRIQGEVMGLGSMSMGEHLVCMTNNRGFMYCAGENSHALGVPGSHERMCPDARNKRCIPGLRGLHWWMNGLAGVAVAGRTIFGIKEGRVLSWGESAYGLLGRNTPLEAINRDEPNLGWLEMPNPEDPVVYVEGTASSRTSCALTASGRLACWGLNDVGQVGQAPADTAMLCPNPNFPAARYECVGAPTAVEGLGTVIDFAVGMRHACAVNDQNELYCWGRNEEGQLGVGWHQTGFCNPRFSPAQENGNDNDHVHCAVTPQRVNLENVTDVAAGNQHSCAVVDSGRVFCWGVGTIWQGGGIGARWDIHVPRMIGRVNDAAEVSTGSNVTCIRHRDHRVSCWGMNARGETGVNSLDDSFQTPRLVEFR